MNEKMKAIIGAATKVSDGVEVVDGEKLSNMIVAECIEIIRHDSALSGVMSEHGEGVARGLQRAIEVIQYGFGVN